jgi:hypothetical protein
MGSNYFLIIFNLMNKKLSYSLTLSLVLLNKLKVENIKEISSFVNSQIKKMPEHFAFVILILSFIFESLIFLTHLRRFNKLNDIKKVKLLGFIKNNSMPIFSLFVRFFESNTLMKYYDLIDEE